MSAAVKSLLKIADLRVNPALDEICRDGVVTKLEPRAMRLLVTLAGRAGQVVSVKELLDLVWQDVIVSPDSVYAAVAALRRILGDDPKNPRYIANVVRRGYRLIAPVSEWVDPPLDAASGAAPALPSMPSIAVMPFGNLSHDPQQVYFVDGLMDEIVSALARIRTLFVIGSGSSRSLKGQDLTAHDAARLLGVRYILEGSVRKDADEIRIIVKLIDSSTDAQIWSDRFSGRLDQVFELQDKVALGAAGVIEFSVQHAEMLRSIKRPTADLKSYDLYLRALVRFRSYTRAGIEEAFELLKRALELDPDFALAASLMASCHAVIAQYQWADDPMAHHLATMDWVERSLRSNSDDPQVLGTAALCHWLRGDIPIARRLADRAVSLNPGSSFPLLCSGMIFVSQGDLQAAEECLERSMRLDPLSPNRNLQLGAMAATRLAQKRFGEAATLSRESSQLGNAPTSVGLTASACGHLGQTRAAQDAIALVKTLTNMTMAQIAAIWYQMAEHRALFLEGITLAERAPQESVVHAWPHGQPDPLSGDHDGVAGQRHKVHG
jgi:TolB-like protein